jgi:hypothetical protein
MGARGVSVGGGVALEEPFKTDCVATLGTEPAGPCDLPDLRALHHSPASTPMKTTFPTSARTNAFRWFLMILLPGWRPSAQRQSRYCLNLGQGRLVLGKRLPVLLVELEHVEEGSEQSLKILAIRLVRRHTGLEFCLRLGN